ncbi:MAG: family 20 glycosylhydrolase [Bacteroidales bacterium]|nr:family 20 glycosylhydrolase [Bacteroidales bacterium]
MKTTFLPALLLIVFAGCSNPEYVLEKVDNPLFKPNVEFQGYEDLNHPGFQVLKEKYQLDTIFQGETDEFKRILMLRHWIRSVVSIDDHGDPYPGGGYVEGILDAALEGQGFHCGHFMKVQNGIMNAYGYVSRTLGAGPGVMDGPDGHHGINEIWLNDYQKWFLSDAKYDHHFEKDGIPLSALEIRDEYLKNRAEDITLVRGPDRIPKQINPETGSSWERSAQTYTWIEYHTHNDMFTVWPEHETLLSMYEDDYFLNHTWIWDGKPHWAYDKPEFMRRVSNRDAIEWTPNTIYSEIRFEGHMARIRLFSETPNLKEYQLRIGSSGEWEAVKDSLDMELSGERHEFHFRTMNLAGVSGPVYRIVIVKKEEGKEEAISALFKEGITLIPYPQEVSFQEGDFIPGDELRIVLDRDATDQVKFTARELARALETEWSIKVEITEQDSPGAIRLTHAGVSEKITSLQEKTALQGYEMLVDKDQLTIRAMGDAGLFYGTQTLLQILKAGEEGYYIPGMKITDWPDIPQRACHYDTKHHQDKREYVEGFIRDLARYKINMLVWEWEDKFLYPSHPEIGAPRAFTMEEMQEITHYAKKYHVQLVPLVQGLGHVSYILKWPQHSHLREIQASNWEFCPLKEGSYDLLWDLWRDAIEATPGSEYIHIGSDETYELGLCELCQQKAEEIGKSGLYHQFIKQAGAPLQALGRSVMAWERPMGWAHSDSPARGVEPLEGLVLMEDYKYESDDYRYAREARAAGYEVFAYDPNPGIEPLFLPYFYKLRGEGENEHEAENALQRSHKEISRAATSGYFDGMINTSWDDSGLHNQVWMMSFINSAEWSWSGANPSMEEFTNKFFLNYYGERSSDMKELFQLLNKAAYYYYKSLERRVWHYGDIGKTHLPDLPRGDNLEYSEFWNREYAEKVEESREQLEHMERTMEIISANRLAGIRNAYDLEIFSSIAQLVMHTCHTYLALSEIELAIKEAHSQRFRNHEAALESMEKAVQIIESNLGDREKVNSELVSIWERTRLPKGMSTDEKEFFHRQDRARHYAFRRADMSYLICDEEELGLEEYKEKLLDYIDYYRSLYFQEELQAAAGI